MKNPDEYVRLAEVLQPFIVIEDVLAINEGIREASLEHLGNISIRAYKFFNELTTIELYKINSFQEPEDIKDKLIKSSGNLKGIINEVLEKLPIFSYLKKMSLEYIVDCKPHIGYTPEGFGFINHERDQNLSSRKFPIVPNVILYNHQNRNEVNDKYEKIIETRNKKLESMRGFSATKDSINYSLLEAKMIGELLGYPSCCVETYVESKRKCHFAILEHSEELETLPPEGYTAIEQWCGLNQYLLRELFSDGFKPEKVVELAQKELPTPFYSRPFSFFYPCTILCSDAINMGKKLEEKAERINTKLSPVYKIGLITSFLHSMSIDMLSDDYTPSEVIDLTKRFVKRRNEIENEFKKINIKVEDIMNNRYLRSFINLIKNDFPSSLYQLSTVLQHRYLFGKGTEELDSFSTIRRKFEVVYSRY